MTGRSVPCPRCGGPGEVVVGSYVACSACDRDDPTPAASDAVPVAVEWERTQCLHRNHRRYWNGQSYEQCLDCGEVWLLDGAP